MTSVHVKSPPLEKKKKKKKKKQKKPKKKKKKKKKKKEWLNLGVSKNWESQFTLTVA